MGGRQKPHEKVVKGLHDPETECKSDSPEHREYQDWATDKPKSGERIDTRNRAVMNIVQDSCLIELR